MQQRPGLRGRPFALLKFRTMLTGEGSDATHPARPLPPRHQPRRAARTLERPQRRHTPEQARRHEVRPGITGWAQINGRNALSWQRKFELDVWYVDHQSLWLDLKILVITLWKVLTRQGISAPGDATMPEFMGARRANREPSADPAPQLRGTTRRPPQMLPPECPEAGRRPQNHRHRHQPRLAAAGHAADESYALPRCLDAAYPQSFIDLCKSKKVDLVVPTIDTELPILAEHAKRLADQGTFAVVSSPDAVALARDKMKTARDLKTMGLRTPRSATVAETLADPGS